jgi:hypothetical protein
LDNLIPVFVWEFGDKVTSLDSCTVYKNVDPWNQFERGVNDSKNLPDVGYISLYHTSLAPQRFYREFRCQFAFITLSLVYTGPLAAKPDIP